MRRVLVAPPVVSPAALEELKAWLAITTPREDAALMALLRTALEACEAFTGVLPLAAEGEEVLPARSGWQTLVTRPVLSVLGVYGLPPGGERFALPVTDYEVDFEAGGRARVRIVRAEVNRVAVPFAAGLADGWGMLPDALRHGVLRLAAHAYREREAGQAQAMPAAVTALWRPWRQVRVT